MGTYEDKLEQILSQGEWQAPSFATVRGSFGVLAETLDALAKHDGVQGSSGDAAGESFKALRGKFEDLEQAVLQMQKVIDKANENLHNARGEAGGLPSAQLPSWIHGAVDAAEVTGKVFIPAMGVSVAANVAVSVFEGFLGGQREEQAKKQYEELNAQLVERGKEITNADPHGARSRDDAGRETGEPPTGTGDPRTRPGNGTGPGTGAGPGIGGTSPYSPGGPRGNYVSPPRVDITDPGGNGSDGGSGSSRNPDYPGVTPPRDGTNPPYFPPPATTLPDDFDGRWPGDDDSYSVDSNDPGVIPGSGGYGPGSGSGPVPGGQSYGPGGPSQGLTAGMMGGGAAAGGAALKYGTGSGAVGGGAVGGGAGGGAGLAGARGAGGSGGLLGAGGQGGAGGTGAGAGSSSAAGSAGANSAGGAGAGRSGMMGMGGQRGGGGGQQKDKRPRLGGHIAPKLEDDDEFVPLPKGARAGGRAASPASEADIADEGPPSD